MGGGRVALEGVERAAAFGFQERADLHRQLGAVLRLAAQLIPVPVAVADAEPLRRHHRHGVEEGLAVVDVAADLAESVDAFVDRLLRHPRQAAIE
ncbi:MAG: hypothetical protein AAFY88_10070, partial [Acidobacteriota bacterium]